MNQKILKAFYRLDFTQAFIESHENRDTLKDYPLFKVGGNHVAFVNKQEQEFIAGLFLKMMEEMESEYIHKYDLLRNYLHIIMHEALKIEPAANFVHTNHLPY